MKKLLLATTVVIALVMGGIYLLIPDEIKIAEVSYIHCSEKGGYRILTNNSNWKKWWPAKSSSINNSNGFNHNKHNFQIGNRYAEGLEMLIKKDTSVYYSLISVIPIKVVSSRLEWRATLSAGRNPFKRAQQYFRAREIKSNMKDIVGNLKLYLEKPENVYAMTITVDKVKDTLLVARKMISGSYPDTEIIYKLVDGLRSYIKSRGAKETNHPMVHVATTSDNVYETTVAIPVNKVLDDSGDLAFKRMVPGNILTAQVKGGISRVKEGEAQLENFVQDYQFVSPAIPFQSLVTNRMLEKDTSKWITILYYPIL